MSDNNRILAFTLIMTTIVALVLGGLFYGLKGMADQNQAVFNKRAILAAINTYLPKPVAELTDEEVQSVFDDNMQQKVILPDGSIDEENIADNVDLAQERKKPIERRKYPMFIYNDGKEDFYIMSIRGNGLWDEIWGNVALKSDLATIAGVSFDHKGETPGLGAEIKDNPKFAEQFENHRIYDYNGTYTSVIVRKGGSKDPVYEVDGISGATVTSDGVTEMLNKGISAYRPYLERIKAENEAVGLLLN